MGSSVNFISRLTLDAHRSMFGIVARLEEKMVLWSAQILDYVEVRTIPLNFRKEKFHGRL